MPEHTVKNKRILKKFNVKPPIDIQVLSIFNHVKFDVDTCPYFLWIKMLQSLQVYILHFVLVDFFKAILNLGKDKLLITVGSIFKKVTP